MTEITQADRDAAEAYREKVLDAIWAGKPEDQVLLEAFARHRMEERAAIVAWLDKKAGGFVLNPPHAYSDTIAAIVSMSIGGCAEAIEAGEHLK